jgi:hypothetical protein
MSAFRTFDQHALALLRELDIGTLPRREEVNFDEETPFSDAGWHDVDAIDLQPEEAEFASVSRGTITLFTRTIGPSRAGPTH